LNGGGRWEGREGGREVRQGVLDAVPFVGIVTAVRRVQRLGRMPGARGVAAVHNDDSLPIMLVPRIHEEHLRAVLLVIQVVRHAHLGIRTLRVGVVEWELWALVSGRDAGVAAVAPNVGVLALAARDRLVRDIIDVGGDGGAAEGPGWVGGDAGDGLGEEEDAEGVGDCDEGLEKGDLRCVIVCQTSTAGVEVGGHLCIGECRDSNYSGGESRKPKEHEAGYHLVLFLSPRVSFGIPAYSSRQRLQWMTGDKIHLQIWTCGGLIREFIARVNNTMRAECDNTNTIRPQPP